MTTKRILELTRLYPVVTIALLGPVAIVFMPHRCARLNANETAGAGYDAVNADLAEEHWCAYAWPIEIGQGQRRLFFVNEDGVVFGTEIKTALGRTGPVPGSTFFPGPETLAEPIAQDPSDQRTRIWHEAR